MSANNALSVLLKAEPEWRGRFKGACEAGAPSVRDVAPRFRDELVERGKRFPLEEVEDALLIGARKALPDSAAAGWSPAWAEELCKDALARLQEVYAGLTLEERDRLDLSAKDGWEDRMLRAGLENDPPAFRAALKGWEGAALEALEAARAATTVVLVKEEM